MNKTLRQSLITAGGIALTASLAAGPSHANSNPFQMTDLGHGYMVADAMGESKYGTNKSKSEEAKCGANKEDAAMKTEESKCGANKAAKPKPIREAKCGESKCGSNK